MHAQCQLYIMIGLASTFWFMGHKAAMLEFLLLLLHELLYLLLLLVPLRLQLEVIRHDARVKVKVYNFSTWATHSLSAHYRL